MLSRSWRRSLGSTVGEKSSTTRSVCQLVKGFGVTSTVSPGERKVRRLCDEVAEEDARPTPLSVELVGVVRPVRPSVFRDWQLSSLFGKWGRLLSPCNPRCAKWRASCTTRPSMSYYRKGSELISLDTNKTIVKKVKTVLKKYIDVCLAAYDVQFDDCNGKVLVLTSSIMAAFNKELRRR
ncbi:hypothetical protein MTO96_012574 [Rhipicephalus appendiculatus]